MGGIEKNLRFGWLLASLLGERDTPGYLYSFFFLQFSN